MDNYNDQIGSYKPWDGVPTELRILCCLEYTYNSSAGMCILPVLNYLTSHMYDCDDPSNAVSAYDIVYWIDTGIDTCLFPIERYEPYWKRYSGIMLTLLIRAEQLISKTDPAIMSSSTITDSNVFCKPTIAELSQKINVYFALCHAFRKEWNYMEDRCMSLLEATKRNVIFLLSTKERDAIIVNNYKFEFRFPGSKPWEPLMWVCEEWIYDKEYVMTILPFCALYVDYLQLLSDEDDDSVCLELLDHANRTFRDLCELGEILSD